MPDVDEGSTVTDFLPAERARGITIQSAAISFSWPPAPADQKPQQPPQPLTSGTPRSSVPHNINLIDTPGHADFTFEVVRSLRVLDGAVCILDGVAGVEAQTEKVWAQATANGIPKIVFVNKLDRDGAAFGKTVREIGLKLAVWPAVCSVPWLTAEGQLQGVGDVVGLRGLRYAAGGDGKEIEVFNLEQLGKEDPKLQAELKKARTALIELLSDHDDEMVERYLEADEDHLTISPADITTSLRKCVLQTPQNVAPAFAGASFRNVGVQPLLDAVVDLLPSPNERPDPEISLDSTTKGGLDALLSGKLPLAASTTESNAKSKKVTKKETPQTALRNIESCALAFKVVADAKRGVLVYVRVYSGALTRSQAALWNTNLQTSERAPRLLKMYANDAVEVDAIAAGQIGVIPGLKLARTGDTLVSYSGPPKNGPPAPLNTLQLKPIHVPPPVFFVSVEPNSLSEEKHIREALDILLREDPSLHVSVDERSGQTHLSGMGELHLEIARDRLVKDFKAMARIGAIEIGYREALTTAAGEVTEHVDREIGGKPLKAGCTAAVEPHFETEPPSPAEKPFYTATLPDNNHLTILAPTLRRDGTSKSDEQPGLPDSLPVATVTRALEIGVAAALARGPTHRYAMHSVAVTLHLDPATQIFGDVTTPAALSAAARAAVQTALKRSADASAPAMMEPVMRVTIAVDADSMGAVVHDLSAARGGSVVSLGTDEEAAGRGHSTPSAAEGITVDVTKIYAPPDEFAGGHASASAGTTKGYATGTIVARVPLKEMVGYLKHLRSLTAGRGTFTMVVDEFEKMNAQRQKAVLNEMRGEY